MDFDLQKVLGLEHPAVATTRVRIANVYQSLGEYKKALDKYNLALPVLEGTLGREHPDVAKDLRQCRFCLRWETLQRHWSTTITTCGSRLDSSVATTRS